MALKSPVRTRLPIEPSPSGRTSKKRWLSVHVAGLLLFTTGLIYCQYGALRSMEIKDGRVRSKSHQESKAEDLSTKPRVSSLSISRLNTTNTKTGNGAIKQYPACPIPQLEPYHESILDYVNKKEFPVGYNCTRSYPLLFNSTLQSRIIPAKGSDYFRDEGYESCCYRTVVREGSAGDPNGREMVSPECFPVHLTAETKIPDGHEFIAIFCKKKGKSATETLVDAHSFVPSKPSSNESKSEQIEEKFNVIIFGMDGISRMNFLRMMPQSYSFLKNELEAVEMFGYNKVGENTPPNLMPMLMSSGTIGRDFDNCPFIWKEYSKQGYYTMFAEDGSASLFHDMGLSFDRQPTDYYLRPFSHFADDKFKTYSCYGPRLTFQYLLEYMEKYVDTMSRNQKNFFGFSWGTALTHSHITTPRLGDPLLLKSLRWLKTSGHLKNTIFILMSDHGIRLDAIHKTIQGQLEERLPLLYFVLPQSFKIKYKLAYHNLLYNADKLMTTFDLHETLKEILNLDMIDNRELLEREDELHRLGRDLPRGISLFLPIPEFRTCKMARIRMNFCSCTYMEVASVSDPKIDASWKAMLAVSRINSILGSNNTSCAFLKLHKVNMVRRVGHKKDFFWSGYSINFETSPGGGQFDALVAKNKDGERWMVQGPIDRTNLYGNQSHCVRDIIKLRPYCYCLD